MGFSRQEYWSGLPFPSPGDLPDLGLLHCKQILYHLCHPISPPHCVDLPTNPGAGKMGLTPPPAPPPNVQHLPMQCRIQENSSLKTDPWVLSNLFLAPELGDSASWCGHVLGRHQFSSVQSLSCVRLFATPWTAAHQASLSITNSRSLLKLMSVESMKSSNHLVLGCVLLLPPSIFPCIRVFSNSQFFPSGGQSTGVSASASVLPMNIQD